MNFLSLTGKPKPFSNHYADFVYIQANDRIKRETLCYNLNRRILLLDLQAILAINDIDRRKIGDAPHISLLLLALESGAQGRGLKLPRMPVGAPL